VHCRSKLPTICFLPSIIHLSHSRTMRQRNTMSTFFHQLTSPPVQTLRTLQPTSSTITYTISTRPVRKTLPAEVGYYTAILFRILLGLSTVLLLWTKWRITYDLSTHNVQQIFGSAQTAQLVQLASQCQWRYLAPFSMIILVLVFRRGYTGTLPSHSLLYTCH
jgi:phosphatidylinositol glycan class H protein